MMDYTTVYYSTGIAAFFFFLQSTFAETLLLSFISGEARATYKSECSKKKSTKALGKANGVAFVHAAIIAPFSVIEAFRLRDSPIFSDHTYVTNFIGIFMMGYFIWDIIECTRCYEIHGAAFLIHSLLSFYGLLLQFVPISGRMPVYVSYLAGTEVSTPFVHIRWILIKGGLTNTLYYKVIDLLALVLFIGYRMTFLPLYVFPKMMRDMFSESGVIQLSAFRRWSLVILITSWLLVNTVWAYKFITGYFNLKKRSKRQDAHQQ